MEFTIDLVYYRPVSGAAELIFLSSLEMCRTAPDYTYRSVGISLRLQGKLGFPYNVKQLMVKYVLLC